MNIPFLRVVVFSVAVAGLRAGAQTVVPDFLLEDANATSLRRRATSAWVSPRDYQHQVTAWFFGWETCSTCRALFSELAAIRGELNGVTVLPVDIIGINQTGGGVNPLMYAGKPLSWVKNTAAADIEARWGAFHQDVFIVDPLSRKVEVFSLSAKPLTVAANRTALKNKLIAAATPADTDGDKLPDYWEQWAYGNLSRHGGTVGPDGTKALLHYAHCSPAPAGGQLPGWPRLIAVEAPEGLSFSLTWTQRRGTAFGLTMAPEFSQDLASWTATGHGYVDWSSRVLYDGSGGEVMAWQSTVPNPFRWARLKTHLP